MSPAARTGYLAVCGLPGDATPREVRVLFSGCAGFLRCRLAFEEVARQPYAVAEFRDEDSACRAAEARRGTTWEDGASPVNICLGQLDSLAKVAQQELRCGSSVAGSPRPQVSVDAPPSSAASPRSPRSARPLAPSGLQDAERRLETQSTSLASPERSLDRRSERLEGPRSSPWVAHQRLQAALERRSIPELDAAIAEGEASGLAQEELDEAERVLLGHRQKREVRDAASAEHRALAKLEKAKASIESEEGDVGQRIAGLQQALQAAAGAAEACAMAGLREGERRLRRASASLEEAWRARARAQLQQALSGNDLELLREALRQGKASGLDREAGVKGVVTRQTLEEARMAFTEEQGRAEARSRVESLLERPHRAGPLRAALAEAKENGVAGDVIKRLERAIAAAEQKALLRWGITTVMLQAKSGSSMEGGALGIMRLRLVHIQARSAGLDAQELANLQDFLGELLARAAATARHARARRRAKASAGLANALAAERKTLLVQQLPKAIQEGRRAHLGRGTLCEASRKLIVATAQANLEQALNQRDVAALPLAIDKAKQIGLEAGLIASATKVLLEEQLLPGVEAALDRGDLADLERSIVEWSEQGLDETMLEHLMRLFNKLKREPAEVRARLDRVFRTPIEFEAESADFTASGLTSVTFAAEVLALCPHMALAIESFLCASEGNSRNTCTKRAEVVRTTLQRSGCRNQMITYAWGHSHPQIKAAVVRILPREPDLSSRVPFARGLPRRCESARELAGGGLKGPSQRAESLSPRRWRL